MVESSKHSGASNKRKRALLTGVAPERLRVLHQTRSLPSGSRLVFALEGAKSGLFLQVRRKSHLYGTFHHPFIIPLCTQIAKMGRCHLLPAPPYHTTYENA